MIALLAFDQEENNKPACFLEMSTEWYTPAQYIKAARAVMGGIDLDPASCELANRVVKATKYYTKHDDGLAQSWYGRVWLNPPYGRTDSKQKANAGAWIRRLIEHHKTGAIEQAILLVNAWTSRKWFDPLWAYPLCFHRGSLSFYNKAGIGSRNPVSNIFVYLGPNEQAFIDVFSRFGTIVKRVPLARETITPRSLWEGMQ